MDKYLQPNSAYERLWAEYNKYGSLIVAVDFDDTLYDFHKAGNTYEQVKQLVKDLKEIGCYIIIWTGNQDTEFVTQYLVENNIPFDSINEEAPISKKLLNGKFPRKVYANVYIDDRAGLFQVYQDLTNLVYEVKNKTFYRVCNENTQQGLWYDFSGKFTGLIHNDFKFCQNNSLEMEFDEELVGWLSAVKNLEDLWQWVSQEDIKQLQKHGWYIFEYKAKDYKFYERFQHLVIKQDTSKVIRKIEL